MKMKKFAAGSAALTLTALISASTVLPANAAQLHDPFASRVYELVNQHRAANGLPALTWNQSLANVAQNWSDTMDPKIEAEGDAGFLHNPFFADQYPAGYFTASENIAINADADTLFQAWKHSSVHNSNMLSPTSTDFGFGYAYIDSGKYARKYFAVQNFAGYQRTEPVDEVIPTIPGAQPLDISASATNVSAGSNVVVSGFTIHPSVDLRITYTYGTTSGIPAHFIQEITLTPNADGEFSYEFTVAADATEGGISLDASAGGNADNAVIFIVPGTPVAETPAEEVPIEVPVEEAPVEETPAEEVPAEGTPVDETPATPVTPPADPAPVVPPADPAPVVPPADETPADETPSDETPVDETPVDETPSEGEPVDEAPTTPVVPPTEPAPVIPPSDGAPADENPTDDTPVTDGPDMHIPGGEDSVPFVPNDPSDDVLDETNRGELAITEDDNIVIIKGLTAGSRYNVWFQSTPTNAGTFTAEANGELVVPIPEGVVAGDHKVAVYQTTGVLVGWASFAIAAETPAETPVDAPVSVPADETPADVPAEVPADVVPGVEASAEETAAVITLDGTAFDVQVQGVEASADVVPAEAAQSEANAVNEPLAETSQQNEAEKLGLFAGALLLLAGAVTAVIRGSRSAGVKN